MLGDGTQVGCIQSKHLPCWPFSLVLIGIFFKEPYCMIFYSLIQWPVFSSPSRLASHLFCVFKASFVHCLPLLSLFMWGITKLGTMGGLDYCQSHFQPQLEWLTMVKIAIHKGCYDWPQILAEEAAKRPDGFASKHMSERQSLDLKLKLSRVWTCPPYTLPWRQRLYASASCIHPGGPWFPPELQLFPLLPSCKTSIFSFSHWATDVPSTSYFLYTLILFNKCFLVLSYALWY